MIEWNSTITKGKFIQSGGIAGYIIPSGVQNIKIVKALVPTTGAGKVEVGNKAIIRFQAYPYKEYGSLVTKVSSISAIPQQISEEVLAYEVLLAIPDSMITDYGEEISYAPNMDVTIQLITESNNIIGRIFNQLYSIIKNT